MSKTHHAYPEHPELEAVMRLASVKRWHMIDTTRTQNLAEHTANVALLAWLIAHNSPGMFWEPQNVLLSAMVHDLGETFLGDVPTHSKILIGKEIVKAAERQVLPSCFARQVASSDSESELLIKLCDLADGIRFIRLHGVDITAKHAQEGLERQLEEHFGTARIGWPLEVWHHVERQVYFYAYEKA